MDLFNEWFGCNKYTNERRCLLPNGMPVIKELHPPIQAHKVEGNGHCYRQPFSECRQNVPHKSRLFSGPVQTKFKVERVIQTGSEEGSIRKDER